MQLHKLSISGNTAHLNAARVRLPTQPFSGIQPKRMHAPAPLCAEGGEGGSSPTEESTSGRDEPLMDRPTRPPPRITRAPPKQK